MPKINIGNVLKIMLRYKHLNNICVEETGENPVLSRNCNPALPESQVDHTE